MVCSAADERAALEAPSLEHTTGGMSRVKSWHIENLLAAARSLPPREQLTVL
jgi:hypothetical protein